MNHLIQGIDPHSDFAKNMRESYTDLLKSVDAIIEEVSQFGLPEEKLKPILDYRMKIFWEAQRWTI